MKIIELTQGRQAIVDDADFLELSKHKWSFLKGYAVRSTPRINGKQKSVKMHRIILSAPAGVDVDHINRNGLDNRRHNLRLCSKSQNQWNRSRAKNNTTGFKGVYFNKTMRRFRAQISVNGRHKTLGSFLTAGEAFSAYSKSALDLHGQFGRLQ